MSTVLNPSDAKCFTGMIQNMCNNVIYEHKLQYIRTYNTYKFVPRDHNYINLSMVRQNSQLE